jgi:AraC-like DNA-binding protein
MTTHQVPVIPANIPALRWENQFENRQNYMGNSSGLSKRNRCKRIYVPADSGVGYWEIIEFDKGFGMVINNANYHSKNILSFDGEGLLKFHFRLQAKSSIYIDPIGYVELDGAACQVFYHPKGVVDYEWIDVGPVDSWISIYCDPNYLANVLEFDLDNLPIPLIRAMSGSLPTPFITHLPMSIGLRQSCTEIAHCSYDGALRAKYFEAQALQLLCETYDKLRSEAEEGSSNLCDRDVKAIHKAYNMLGESFERPPNIANLSRAVGVNRNKLLTGFKSLFGMTLQNFCLQKRMSKGRALLMDTDEPISGIAEQVGYDHPNNFSSAFKRFYGCSPTQARGKDVTLPSSSSEELARSESDLIA